MFSTQRVYDATYDAHSGLVIFAHNSSLYGMDADNRLTRLAGDDGSECLLGDGPAHDARFVGAQRVAADGSGITYIRDRDSRSANGFCLRALQEASMPTDGQLTGSGMRAVVTIRTNYDVGPRSFAYEPHRRALLFTTRGRAIHALHPHGFIEELVGSEDTPIPAFSSHAANVAAAAASASCSSDASACDSDSEASGPLDPHHGDPGSSPGGYTFTNIQSLAADPDTGKVYLLEGTSNSTSKLLALHPDGRLEVVAQRLRVAPPGGTQWPRVKVLPEGHLAVYGTNTHDMMLLQL